jgi:GNAT superfamily N-acetyltransferase
MFGSPVPIGSLHVTDPFDCGTEPLNVYLKQYAGQNERRGGSRTYVIAGRDNRVVGYYTLAVGSVEPGNAPASVAKGLGKYPIPVIILARLATDKSIQGKGFGLALLKDALRRALNVSREVGVRAVLVHAKDKRACDWYKKSAGFVESPTDPFHLLLLIKDIEEMLKVKV